MIHKCKIKYLLFVLYLIIALPTFCYTQETNLIYDEKPIFEKLTSIKDVDSLIKYYNSIAIPDPVVKIVYASQRNTIRGSNDDEIFLLSVIPQSVLEASNLYVLTDPKSKEWDVNETISTIPYTYIVQISKAVAKHPEYLQNYFKYAASTDGEYAEAFSSECAYVLEQRCVDFFKTLVTMHPDIEDAIIGILGLEYWNDDCLRKNINNIPSKYIKIFNIK